MGDPHMFLVAGGDSEIGTSLAAHLRQRQRPVVVTTRRRDRVGADRTLLDLEGDLSRWDPPPGVTAAIICAAVARPADCAADPAMSARINITGTLALAERLIARGVYLLFLSACRVFDGLAPNMRADAPTAPVSEYGKQKARTEAALRAQIARGAPVGILRLAKVVSPQNSLLNDWVATLTAGKPIRPFHDMTMAPAPMNAVVRAIEALMADRATGVFQLSGPRDVTYEEVGRFLAERLGVDPELVVPSSVKKAGLPIAPVHTTLDSSALRERYGIVVPDAWEVLDAVLQS